MGTRWAGRRAAALGVAVVLAATLGLGAPSAGAQTTPTTSPFTCSYNVDPTTLPPGGGVVTLTGVAPGSSTVRIFLDGVEAATAQAAPVTGEWSAEVLITASVEIAVAVDGYPSTPCIGVGGESVERDGGGSGIVVAGSGAQRRFAFTGSDSEPLVLIGLAALSLGVVLVVAARRRAQVQGRG